MGRVVVNYIEVLRERARNNIWKHWQKLQEKYDSLPWYKRLFRENPKYGDTTGFGHIALDHGHWLNKVDSTEDIVFLQYWAKYIGEENL